jgi:TetR/AcrR family transcriptional regulator, transcriptional repressor for nem operon
VSKSQLYHYFGDKDDLLRAVVCHSADQVLGKPLVVGLERLRERGVLRADGDPARPAGATMASIQGGLLLSRLRRDPQAMGIALEAALAHLKLHAA